MSYLRYFVTAWLMCGAALVFGADTPSLRPGYGASPYPIWSELSYFENDTLSAKAQAERNDAKALLAFYVLASGERNLADYENIQRRVSALLDTVGEKIQKDQDPWRRADTLHRAMHKEFFVAPGIRNGGGGYDEDQSKLSGIFATGQYNCISASLLYVVLARELGFATQGVLLPSHAFVEIALPDGRLAEVETTSPEGFGTIHNQAFYESAASWFKERGLRASTINDYHNRKKVSPLALGAMNMLNQHTRPERMNFTDAARLAEISALLDPQNALAQEKRLHFYMQEIDKLTAANSWHDLARLFTTVLADVRLASANFPQHNAIQNTASWMHFSALFTYAHLEKTDTYINMLRIINNLPLNREQQAQAQTAFGNSAALMLHQLSEKNAFEEGLIFISEAEPFLATNPAWPATIGSFYNMWAAQRWQQQDWPGVVDVLDDYFAQPYRDRKNNDSVKNLRSAYHNWVASYLNVGDKLAAKTVVESCQQKFPQLAVCDSAQAAVKNIH